VWRRGLLLVYISSTRKILHIVQYYLIRSTANTVRLLLRIAGATEAPSGDLELELAAMQACYVQLKQLVPTVPLNAEVSSLQLLQHVIDYIADLELALHSSASVSSTQRHPHQQQQQQPDASPCCSRKTTTHSNSQRQSLSAALSADERQSSSHATPDISHTLPSASCTPRDTEHHSVRNTELSSSQI